MAGGVGTYIWRGVDSMVDIHKAGLLHLSDKKKTEVNAPRLLLQARTQQRPQKRP